MARVEWKFLPVTDGTQAVRRNPERDEVGLDRHGPAFTQREVVLGRSALVAVPLDSYDPGTVAPQHVGVRAGRRLRDVVKVGAVQHEEDRLEGGIAVEVVQRLVAYAIVSDGLRRHGQIFGHALRRLRQRRRRRRWYVRRSR